MEQSVSPISTSEVLTIDEAMARVRAAGWGGLSVWSFYNRRKEAPEFMACLIRPNGEPDYSTNLWDYMKSATDALIKIAERTERDGPQE